MANIQANVKRHEQDVKKHIQIHSQLSAMKTQIKKAQKTKSKKDLSLAYKIIDNCLSKGIIKKNKADRLKSRLALFVNDEKRVVVSHHESKKVVAKKAKPAAAKPVEAKTTTTAKPVSAKKPASKSATVKKTVKKDTAKK